MRAFAQVNRRLLGVAVTAADAVHSQRQEPMSGAILNHQTHLLDNSMYSCALPVALRLGDYRQQ